MVLGQGLAATHFAVGLERLKKGEIKPHGIPLADLDLGYEFENIEIVGSVDVDARKVGLDAYTVAGELYGMENIPETLKKIKIFAGLEFASLSDMNIPIRSLDAEVSPLEAVEEFYETIVRLSPDVFIDVCTTQNAAPVYSLEKFEKQLETGQVSPSQVYAYLALRYSSEYKPVGYVNLIPTPVANNPGFVEAAVKAGAVVLGDDGATGATPLTADILEHMRERNRRVYSIAQFNIGGNTDFLALTDEARNKAKELTKSSIVADILGYEPPHFIKPTGFLEPLGDKKFVAMHILFESFNGAVDEIIVNMRISDSPALAGYMVDLARLAKLALDKGLAGTIYQINAFYMKKPAPPGSKNMARILAYQNLLNFVEKLKTGTILEESIQYR